MKFQQYIPLFTSLTAVAGAVSTFNPARPPSIPLAVKSPYLSTWQNAGSDGGNGGYLAGQWTTHWANQITGWAGLIRVDNTTYTWLGAPGPQSVNQLSYTYTSTKSVFTMDVGGKVMMNITFLSPITPNDMKRQSLVFNYLEVNVASSDGATHIVELYSDISAEWISGDRSAVAQWSYGAVENVAYHQVFRKEQLLFTETADQADWGYWYWATDNTHALTYQSGADIDVRGQFENNGYLLDTNDTNFRPIPQNWPVFGFAINLGAVSKKSTSTLFSLGLAQQEAVQFAGASGIVASPSLWTSYFPDDLSALSFFHNDYKHSSKLSAALDKQIQADSVADGGQDYATITTLSLRQTFGATQLTGNCTKPYLFLKEISSDGNCQTVDMIFPAFPAFAYTNPTFLKLLLDPLFENQESGQYPNTYSMHDLGSHYPNATGHPAGNDEPMPLEECGNMLIMTLLYAQRASDVEYLSRHYNILNQWTGYLVNDALYPANQISTDDFAGPLANQTNLALKGMIGIAAMAQIANLTGNAIDYLNYANISQSYITQWQKLAIETDATPPHTTLSYGGNGTHGLLYNLYGDALLGLHLVPQSVYDMQSAFYPTVVAPYGVPLDTRHSYTKGDWEMFAAAVASASTKGMLIHDLANWINTTPTNRPLSDLFETDTGDYPGFAFVARPAVGGTFAALLLGQSTKG